MVTLTPRGPFTLAASSRFIEGFAPAGRDAALAEGPLRFAFPVEGTGRTAGVALTQVADGDVHAEVVGEESPELVAQLARLLSLDVDGAGYPTVVAADPVVDRLAQAHPGLVVSTKVVYDGPRCG